MEIKATLNKPYTDDERIDFIIQENRQNGYVIKETELALEAWGLTEQEQAEQKQYRINNLTMTPLDFIKVLEYFGLTLEQINAFLESNLEIKMQLTYCNLVYCGVVKQFLPIEIVVPFPPETICPLPNVDLGPM